MLLAIAIVVLLAVAALWVSFPYCLGAVKSRLRKIPRSTGAMVSVKEDVVVLTSRSHPDNEIRISEPSPPYLSVCRITFHSPKLSLRYQGLSLWECNWKLRSQVGDQWYQIPADIRKTYDLIYPKDRSLL